MSEFIYETADEVRSEVDGKRYLILNSNYGAEGTSVIRHIPVDDNDMPIKDASGDGFKEEEVPFNYESLPLELKKQQVEADKAILDYLKQTK